MEQIIEIKVGDKVIRSDGLAGMVVSVTVNGSMIPDHIIKFLWYAEAKMENGEKIAFTDSQEDLKRFYLIGTTILGNKRPIEELDDRIADTHQKIERLKIQEKQLRKQRWRLEYQMNPDLYKPQDGKSDKED